MIADGGNSEDEAVSCSGGRRDDGCFSARFMFRTGGKGEMYTYLPPSYSANKAVCDVAPQSECNSVYGASVGRGSFNFKAGTRTTIGQRVRLNDAGASNGELELFVGGKSIFTVTGLVLRNTDAGRIRGIQMQTFFGGTCPVLRPPARHMLIPSPLCRRLRLVVGVPQGPELVLLRLLPCGHREALSCPALASPPPHAPRRTFSHARPFTPHHCPPRLSSPHSPPHSPALPHTRSPSPRIPFLLI